MHRYWPTVIAGLLDATDGRSILAVAHDDAVLAQRLAEYAVRTDAYVTVADRALAADATALERASEGRLRVRPVHPLGVLHDPFVPDVALIDGHPNWYTVSTLLRGLENQALAASDVPPVFAVHDTRWPFGRRDGYRDLDDVPAGQRQPVSELGLLPAQRAPSEDGVQTGLLHAVADYGERNGVRTAIDDFLAGSEVDYRLVDLPGFDGLALIVPAERLAQRPALNELVRRLRSPAFLEDHCRRVDIARLEAVAASQRDAVVGAGACAPLADDAVVPLQVELDAMRAAAEARAGRIADLEHELAHARAAELEREHLRTALQAVQRQRDDAAARYAAADAATERIDAEREALDSERRALRAEIEQNRQAHQARVDALEVELAEARRAVMEAAGERERVERLRTALAEVEREREDLRATARRIDQLERELESRDVQLAAARHQETQLAARATALHERVDTLEVELNAAHARQSTIEAYTSALLQQRADMSDQTERARADIQRARDSRAWRLGHGLTSLLRRMTFRRTHGTNALDRALEQLEPPPPLPGTAVDRAALQAPAPEHPIETHVPSQRR